MERIGWTAEEFDDGGRGAVLGAAFTAAVEALRARGILGSDDDVDDPIADNTTTTDGTLDGTPLAEQPLAA